MARGFRELRVRWRGGGGVAILASLMARGGVAVAAPPPPYPLDFAPGTPPEQALVVKSNGAAVIGGARHADPGQFWVYGLPAIAGARCRLELTLEGDAGGPEPNINVLGANNKPLPYHTERAADGTFVVIWTAPDPWQPGERVRIIIGAKSAPITVRSVRYLHTEADNNGDGVPDALMGWLAEGQGPGVSVTSVRAPERPYTITQAAALPTPATDLQTDALFAAAPDAPLIAGWKGRGYAVWTQGGLADSKDYAQKHPDEVQTGPDGKPVPAGDSALIAPTAGRIGAEHDFFAAALAAGSDGICLQGAEYDANAGYNAAFKEAWQAQYHEPWHAPTNSLDVRYHASRLMASLETDYVATLLQSFGNSNPAVLRLAALRSPLASAQLGLISPQWSISLLPSVQEVLGQLTPELIRSPLRYAGARRALPFAQAYLGYSALRNLLRDTGKRLWLPIDTFADTSDLTPADRKMLFEQSVVAALMCTDVSAYQMLPGADRLLNATSADSAAEYENVLTVLADMHNQTRGGSQTPEEFGVLVGDSLQWQRAAPNISDLDGLFGLALPLLQHGVPVQIAALERTIDPGYLNRYRVLLLSYDYQKPLGARTQAALADWVRRGGSLMFFGGSDSYNGVRDSWWGQLNLPAPQSDLWTQLGLDTGGPPVARSAPSEDLAHYEPLLQIANPVPDLRNRNSYTADITRVAQQTGSVALRFTSAPGAGQPGQGVFVASVELRINGQLAASFLAGSEIENRFLFYDRNSQVNGAGRTADGGSSWTYQFDNLPRGVPLTLTLDMAGNYLVQAAAARPDFGHTLLTTGQIAGLAQAYPRVRIGAAYPATLYPIAGAPLPAAGAQAPTEGSKTEGSKTEGSKSVGSRLVEAQQPVAPNRPAAIAGQQPAIGNRSPLTVLYNLRAGGAPIWMQQVGRGWIMNVGVAPGFFSSSERSSGLLRALTRLACGRAGGTYREPQALVVRRGRYIVLRAGNDDRQIEGRTIDLFSPTLAVAEDRVVPAHTAALLYDIGPADAAPHIGFIAGRVQARLETPRATAFFVRGAQALPGLARLHRGQSRLLGVRAIDRLGRPVPIQAIEDGGTVLLRYANSPDGIAVRVGWQ
jgi:hypothetical protein